MSDTSDFMPSQLNNMMDIPNIKKILDVTEQVVPQLKKVEFSEVGQVTTVPIKNLPSVKTEQIINPVNPVNPVNHIYIDKQCEKQISSDLVKIFNIFVPKQTCGLTFILIIIGLIIFYMSREPKKIDNNNV